MTDEKIIVLDFGGQYNQLIARRVREAGVYCEVLPCDVCADKLSGANVKGIIFTGGPSSVYDTNAPVCAQETYSLGVPVLGICYGMQLMALHEGGAVSSGEVSEFGGVPLFYDDHPLFAGVQGSLDAEGRRYTTVWMNHNDRLDKTPAGFKAIARTAHCPAAAIANDERRLYAVQFHPEVRHTRDGFTILKNFLYRVCGCAGGWSVGSIIDRCVEDIRDKVGGGRAVAALSGGVDSSVASVLVHKAIGDRLTCIFVDHGLLRKNEADEIMDFYKDSLGLSIIRVDAQKRFLDKLAGISDPEKKRKIIGEEFIRVFEEEAKKLGSPEFLVQGTIYPDVIESGGVKNAAVIKSHHNVGGLPENIEFKRIIEPLRALFKDEVRELGEKLGVPRRLVWRQPFPGPGLAVRVLGEITEEKLRMVRDSDAILREEIAAAGLENDIWQYFTVFPGVRTVGVMGDGRTYDNLIAIRAVTSADAMTVEIAEIPYSVLRVIASRIVNEVDGVNRVVYDVTSKPPGTIEWE